MLLQALGQKKRGVKPASPFDEAGLCSENNPDSPESGQLTGFAGTTLKRANSRLGLSHWGLSCDA